MNLFTLLHRLAARVRMDEDATLAEYGLLAFGIAVFVAAVVSAQGGEVLALHDFPAPF